MNIYDNIMAVFIYDNVMNVGRDKAAKIILHDFGSHFGNYFFIFFLVLASSKKVF